MKKILSQNFFNRSTQLVGRELLGKFLVRRSGQKVLVAMITEVEVYDGRRDRASHASRGRTKKNAPMFGQPGHWYIYFTYGRHWMLNIVTREVGYPAAILIRGVSEIPGPARLTRYFNINKTFNSLPAKKKTGLWIEDRGARIPMAKIKTSRRIGVAYASRYWASRRLRFFI